MTINANITKNRRQRAYALTDGKCWYCGAMATTVDHGLPLIQGGKNSSDNLYPACQRCNGMKRGSTIEEFRAWLPIFYELPSRQQPDDPLYQHFKVGRFMERFSGSTRNHFVCMRQNMALFR
jgi:HNH endonuclease